MSRDPIAIGCVVSSLESSDYAIRNDRILITLNSQSITLNLKHGHSVRSDFTGFEIAAFKALRPTVPSAMSNATTPAPANTHQ
jgi:hypothetical protein